MEYEVEGPRPRGRPKRTWREVVKEDCLPRKLNKEDAMDRSKWKKLIRMSDDQDGCEWVSVSSGTGLLRLYQTKAVKRCVCVCVCACVTELLDSLPTCRPEHAGES